MTSNNYLPDIFKTNEAKTILCNKYVLFIGDSVIRGMYKDMVKFIQKNDKLTDSQLKDKGEFYFEGDLLLQGGRIAPSMTNDTTYREIREFKNGTHLIRFYFITRCYSDYLISICDDIKNNYIKPDVVIMNSGCWDLTRYGMNSMNEYKMNLPKGLITLMSCLPSKTSFIWTTTLPLAKYVRGGFMVPEVENMRGRLRDDLLKTNRYACIVTRKLKLDLIDLQYYFHKQTGHRCKDGIHWKPPVHRSISNIILYHLCKTWGIRTPSSRYIDKNPKILEPSGEFLDEEENVDLNTSEKNGLCNNSKTTNNEVANKKNGAEIITQGTLPEDPSNECMKQIQVHVSNKNEKERRSEAVKRKINRWDVTPEEISALKKSKPETEVNTDLVSKNNNQVENQIPTIQNTVNTVQSSMQQVYYQQQPYHYDPYQQYQYMQLQYQQSLIYDPYTRHQFQQLQTNLKQYQMSQNAPLSYSSNNSMVNFNFANMPPTPPQYPPLQQTTNQYYSYFGNYGPIFLHPSGNFQKHS